MRKFLVLLILVLVSYSNVCLSQPPVASTIVESEVPSFVNYDTLNKELKEIEEKLISKKMKIKETVEHIKDLGKKQDAVIETRKSNEHDLTVIQKRIEALGDISGVGEKEPKDLASKRKEFSSQAAKLKSKIAEADLTIAKIDELDNLILNFRNKELLGNILMKQTYLDSPTAYLVTLGHFIEFFYDIIKSPISWYQDLDPKDKDEVKGNIVYVASTILISLLIAIYLSIFIKKRFGYRKSIENPDYGKKVFAAIWVLIAYGVIPSAIIGAFILWVRNSSFITGSFFGLVVNKSAFYLLAIFLSQAVVRVIFTPNKDKWRLIEVSNDKANSISHALLLSIILISGASFFQRIAVETYYPADVIYFVKMLSTGIKAFAITFVSGKFLYDTIALTEEEMSIDEDIGELSSSSKISLLISFLSIGIFSMSLFGYVNLAEFIFDRFIVSVLVIGLFYIFDKALSVIISRILDLKFWTRNFRVKKKNLKNISFWINFFINPVVLSFMALIILALWGVSIDILLQNIKKFLTAFYIGGIKISIISIVFGIFIFFASWTTFKILRRSLLVGVLTKIEMDDGVRSSLSSGFGFFGFISSLLFSFSAMGANLGNLALVAGALSFGVGLGLQNIVSNFVSGIIILFERPIKIGDWVIINGQEGIVKQINIRATELETGSKSYIIIPNATILSSSLTNLTHHGKLGRVDISVGVSYKSDLKQVKQILLDIAKSNKKVLSNPAPIVAFKDLADSSLDFELRCYTSDIMSKTTISNELREAVIDKFREANINIPYPHRVVVAQPSS